MVASARQDREGNASRLVGTDRSELLPLPARIVPNGDAYTRALIRSDAQDEARQIFVLAMLPLIAPLTAYQRTGSLSVIPLPPTERMTALLFRSV